MGLNSWTGPGGSDGFSAGIVRIVKSDGKKADVEMVIGGKTFKHTVSLAEGIKPLDAKEVDVFSAMLLRVLMQGTSLRNLI